MNQSYAVIFTAELSADLEGYDETAARMRELVQKQPGFLGMQNVTEGGCEITVSYWQSLDDIRNWKAHPEHLRAQEAGRRKWYRHYKIEIAGIQRKYEFSE